MPNLATTCPGRSRRLPRSRDAVAGTLPRCSRPLVRLPSNDGRANHFDMPIVRTFGRGLAPLRSQWTPSLSRPRSPCHQREPGTTVGESQRTERIGVSLRPRGGVLRRRSRTRSSGRNAGRRPVGDEAPPRRRPRHAPVPRTAASGSPRGAAPTVRRRRRGHDPTSYPFLHCCSPWREIPGSPGSLIQLRRRVRRTRR